MNKTRYFLNGTEKLDSFRINSTAVRLIHYYSIFFVLCSVNAAASPRDLIMSATRGLPAEIDEVISYLAPIEAAQKELMAKEALPKVLRYKLMLVTTSGAGCLRCTCAAVKSLKELKVSKEEIVNLQTNIEGAKLPEKEKALLLMAKAITLMPETSARSVSRAQEVGWSDRELANAILIVSHFNMKTRILTAFDLGPDSDHLYKSDQKLPMTSCP